MSETTPCTAYTAASCIDSIAAVGAVVVDAEGIEIRRAARILDGPAPLPGVDAPIRSSSAGELAALLFAIETSPESDPLVIVSSSTYAVDVVAGRCAARAHGALVALAQRTLRQRGAELRRLADSEQARHRTAQHAAREALGRRPTPREMAT